MRRTIHTAILALAALTLLGGLAHADRIKDVASINGVRSNQLIGYGLVVGLDGTGDQTSQTQFTVQSLKSMLANLGVTLPPGVNPQLKNVAAVMVTAELPAFAKPGQTIDVVASSIGNAKSLRGGTLLMTPMKGADGQTYALAQGNLLVSGFGAEGDDGSSITVNIPSAGGIPNGATVERGVLSPFADSPTLIMNLFGPDFTTAQRVVTSINTSMGAGVARALDATSIEIQAPVEPAAKVAFASMVENLEVVPAVAPARVMISSRTGTVVLSGEVRIERAAVAHGNLTVTVSESLNVSQPGALARRGQTVVTPESQLSVDQEDAKMFMVETGVSLNDVVAAVNRVGAAPGDLVAILYALQRAGALRAQLIVI